MDDLGAEDTNENVSLGMASPTDTDNLYILPGRKEALEFRLVLLIMTFLNLWDISSNLVLY
jgi:hypothetical protein